MSMSLPSNSIPHMIWTCKQRTKVLQCRQAQSPLKQKLGKKNTKPKIVELEIKSKNVH